MLAKPTKNINKIPIFDDSEGDTNNSHNSQIPVMTKAIDINKIKLAFNLLV